MICSSSVVKFRESLTDSFPSVSENSSVCHLPGAQLLHICMREWHTKLCVWISKVMRKNKNPNRLQCCLKFSVSNEPYFLYFLDIKCDLHVFHAATWLLTKQLQIAWTLERGWAKTVFPPCLTGNLNCSSPLNHRQSLDPCFL